MKKILSRTARDNWASVLDDVQWRGEEYVILRGSENKPVARLVPYQSPASEEDVDG
uniref:type II toxin-antitoxin system Phd/YefM family antitoxin n=1 Tax=Amycolatopsis sp. CA-293810 TaxID=3239926 RepID=UPI003F496841